MGSGLILDTNALSAWADGIHDAGVKLNQADSIKIPSIALGEFLFGIQQSRDRLEYLEFLNDHLPSVEIVSVSAETAKQYSEIRLELKKIGKPIPVNDTWIAAIARQLKEPILTNDHHFDYVSNIETVSF
jgi:tRNA(fMet)-specific endonuclease VapC